MGCFHKLVKEPNLPIEEGEKKLVARAGEARGNMGDGVAKEKGGSGMSSGSSKKRIAIDYRRQERGRRRGEKDRRIQKEKRMAQRHIEEETGAFMGEGRNSKYVKAELKPEPGRGTRFLTEGGKDDNLEHHKGRGRRDYPFERRKKEMDDLGGRLD